jgi:hypothetical protein
MAGMKLTMQLKLLPLPEQADGMLRTMQRFNAACDALAAWRLQRSVKKVAGGSK